MNRILLIGATGNVGSQVLSQLLDKGEQVRALAVIPGPGVNMLLDAWAAAAGQPAFVTSTVAELTGTPARTFREWATDHAAEFRN